VAADPACPPDWHADLGLARAAQRHHADALTAYETALARQPDAPASWHYRAGASYEAMGRMPDAAREYTAWLDGRPGTTDLERRLLAAGPQELGARRAVAELLVEAIGGIRAAAGRHSAVVEDMSDTIFTYWGQGLDEAPPVVRMCHRNLIEHSSRPVVFLDDATLDRYVRVPGDIAASPMTRTQRSDFLRMELLSRYGGTWVDATCLFLEDPARPLAQLGANGFFAFTKRNRTVGTWLIHSEPDGYLVRLFREALYAVWRRFGRNPHYFTIQHVFEVLTLVDDQFRQGWEAMPRRSFTGPLAFRHAITAPYEPERYRDLLSRAFVTKLTYKYDEADVTPDTMLGHLLAEHS
jgi:tetratricopeptide (TPR) repeat protein